MQGPDAEHRVERPTLAITISDSSAGNVISSATSRTPISDSEDEDDKRMTKEEEFKAAASSDLGKRKRVRTATASSSYAPKRRKDSMEE